MGMFFWEENISLYLLQTKMLYKEHKLKNLLLVVIATCVNKCAPAKL
jgi:hypothetical protein